MNDLKDFLSYITNFAKNVGRDYSGLETLAPFTRGPKTPVKGTAPAVRGAVNRGAAGRPQRRAGDFIKKDRQPFPQEYVRPTEGAADAYNLDPAILASLIAQESGGAAHNYNPQTEHALSDAYGLGQIIPQWQYQNLGYESPEALQAFLETASPEEQIYSIARIIDFYMQNQGVEPYDAMRMYKEGPGAYQNDRAQNYMDEIFARIGY